MNKNILLATLFSSIAVAAIVLSFRSLIPAESLIGYVTVLAMLALVTLEYRIDWKRFFVRS